MKSFLFVVDPSWGESRGVVIRDTRVPIVSQLTSHLEQQKVICYYAHCVFAVIPRCAVFPNIYLDMLLLRQRPQGRQEGLMSICFSTHSNKKCMNMYVAISKQLLG